MVARQWYGQAHPNSPCPPHLELIFYCRGQVAHLDKPSRQQGARRTAPHQSRRSTTSAASGSGQARTSPTGPTPDLFPKSLPLGWLFGGLTLVDNGLHVFMELHVGRLRPLGERLGEFRLEGAALCEVPVTTVCLTEVDVSTAELAGALLHRNTRGFLNHVEEANIWVVLLAHTLGAGTTSATSFHSRKHSAPGQNGKRQAGIFAKGQNGMPLCRFAVMPVCRFANPVGRRLEIPALVGACVRW